jgi:hypothetical protein
MLAIGNKTDIKPLVYFVGLSAKPTCEHLDPETQTGRIIERIIDRLPYINPVKTNLVKFAPLDKMGKLRYPSQKEMKSGWSDLQSEINSREPFLVVMLGQQVSYYVRVQLGVTPPKALLPADFAYESILSNHKPYLLSVHHPSFVSVYRSKHIQKYIERVVQSISYLVINKEQLSHHT